jgi:hypothetical protein
MHFVLQKTRMLTFFRMLFSSRKKFVQTRRSSRKNTHKKLSVPMAVGDSLFSAILLR